MKISIFLILSLNLICASQIGAAQDDEKHSPVVTALSNDCGNLYKYVQEDNRPAITQMIANVKVYQQTKYTDYHCGRISNHKLKSHVSKFYFHSLEERNEKAVQLLAPLNFTINNDDSALWRLKVFTDDHRDTHRWEIDTLSRVPGVMIMNLNASDESDIKGAWPYISHQTQKRITAEATQYYNDFCVKNLEHSSTEETKDCRKIRKALTTFKAALAEGDTPSANSMPGEVSTANTENN